MKLRIEEKPGSNFSFLVWSRFLFWNWDLLGRFKTLEEAEEFVVIYQNRVVKNYKI